MRDRSPSTESHVSSNSQSISPYNQLSPESSQSSISIAAHQEPLIEVEHSPQLQNLDKCVDPLEKRDNEYSNLDKQISQSVNFYDNSLHYDDNCVMMNKSNTEFSSKHFEKEN
ncbi:unnamed protein product [Lepeophtheirus salmonis]|uniref:(salmon louse) hypothetical protein n=1 Tax=Lepeophtheirus salmonis TaxID=72036 RepID=A0A7R8H7Q3_LEPSM|nr:unnamed protein product [Lepeophtheirus salmonis]CAF2906050.1 unnamed protein product [Lepeophtheirus salmonis]